MIYTVYVLGVVTTTWKRDSPEFYPEDDPGEHWECAACGAHRYCNPHNREDALAEPHDEECAVRCATHVHAT